MESKIVCVDNIKGMKTLPDESVNIVVTSPPYNVGGEKHNPMLYNFYDDSQPLVSYLEWLCDVFEEVYRVMTPDGRVVVNIGAQKNGRVPLNYHVIAMMRDIGFHVYSQIIWDKGHTSRNSAFGSWLKPSCPSFITTFEYILVFYKDERKLNPMYHETVATDLTKEEFVEWARAMWSFPGKKDKVHPAAFPIELPRRCIKMLSYVGDVVLDPFCGVGTTCVAAKKLSRKYIGFDIDKLYAQETKRRLMKF